MKRKWLFIPALIAALIFFGAVVMGLWNAILPAVLGVKSISFLQALGILLLSKILFGGFAGRFCGNGKGAKWQQMKENYMNMSPEEKEKWKAEWKSRCGSRWGKETRQSNTVKEEHS